MNQVLTRELQIYFEKITESLEHANVQVRNLAIESVSSDPGIQGLMPYFVQFIADTVSFFLINYNILGDAKYEEFEYALDHDAIITCYFT